VNAYIKCIYYERRFLMSNRNRLGFLVACLVGVVFIITLLAAFPPTGYVDEEVAVEKIQQPPRIYQNTDPTLLVPEATMGEKPQQYVHNWDENPVAYVPEASAVDVSMFSQEVPTIEKLRQYPHNWDNNPVAYVPEATAVDVSMFSQEVPTIEKLRQYPHNWDNNPVAYVPEATVIGTSISARSQP
jgi:hypothetical protein